MLVLFIAMQGRVMAAADPQPGQLVHTDANNKDGAIGGAGDSGPVINVTPPKVENVTKTTDPQIIDANGVKSSVSAANNSASTSTLNQSQASSKTNIALWFISILALLLNFFVIFFLVKISNKINNK